jgi:hypothetical protein
MRKVTIVVGDYSDTEVFSYHFLHHSKEPIILHNFLDKHHNDLSRVGQAITTLLSTIIATHKFTTFLTTLLAEHVLDTCLAS